MSILEVKTESDVTVAFGMKKSKKVYGSLDKTGL